jgi:tRNA-2-methylthio-N6-dimethylallyladenosine synthase
MKTYFIKTFGCQMNEADSQRVASVLTTNGLREISEIDNADLVIFTTCGVRKSAEDRAFGQIHNLWEKNPKTTIVVTGCLGNREDIKRRLGKKVTHFIAIKDILQLPSLLALQKKKSFEQKEGTDYLKVLPNYKNKNSALVPIMTGCNNFCTYCVVPYARGRECSRSVDEILKEVDVLFQNNCAEITLLGQNVNSYSFEVAKGNVVNFPTLLDLLAKQYPLILFRFLTSHPKDFSNQLIEVIAQNDNISKEIHLPIQSGSDKILKAMNRKYTQKHYLRIIERIKKKIPTARLSTDVIVGFPGETLEDFEETAKIFKTTDFYMAFINKYSPRPGTVAEKLGDPIPWEEKKRRENVLRNLL